MPKSQSRKPLITAFAIIALCAATAGCVSDMETASSAVTPANGNTATMRYYGGPKYPMWPSSQ